MSDLEEAEVDKGLLASLTTWMLQMDKDKTGKVSKTGSRVLTTKTKTTYHNIISQLEHFFKMIGDYDSLLILQDHPPENCISMKVESLLQFVDYKFGKKDTQLTDMCGRPVQSVDVSKNPLMCTETWHAPKKINQFCAAVKILHLAMGHRDPYREACRECRALPVEHQFKGCRSHGGNPRIMRQGNPIDSGFFDDKKKDIKTLLKDYKSKGCSQLLPSYVRRMRERLISSNNLIDFQTYVIILVAIKLFLRQDEFGDIKIDRFVPELFVVKEGGVIGLLVKVFGKCDDDWVHLYLWLDEDYPELCAVRHLLVYLFLIGDQGWVFVSSRERTFAATTRWCVHDHIVSRCNADPC